jgi:hypothetical protein
MVKIKKGKLSNNEEDFPEPYLMAILLALPIFVCQI